MTFKLGMTVDLCMAYIFMLVSMTLTLLMLFIFLFSTECFDGHFVLCLLCFIPLCYYRIEVKQCSFFLQISKDQFNEEFIGSKRHAGDSSDE